MKLRTFYNLSKWALVLDSVFVITAGSALYIWLSFNSILGSLLLLPGLVCFFKGLEIHATLPKRYKAWQDLVNINSDNISQESFKEYIAAPCGRALAQDVLTEIDKANVYKDLKEKYYSGFWSRGEEPQIMIIKNIDKDSVHESN